jgi:hypothetical protein
MTNPSESNSRQNTWAQPVDRLKVPNLQAGAVNLNVEGRKITGPVQGFGQMWQKTYTVRLAGSPLSPQALIQGWKENFASFWPQGNRFYSRATIIEPGQVAVLNLAGPHGINPPGGPLISTGIMVIYADEESFSFMTPEGHMFAGMITFSASREGDDTIAQIQALVRASDPVYELSFRLRFGHKMEDDFWLQTLRNLVVHFNSSGSQPKLQAVVVDPRLQWSEAKNIWHNAAIRTTFYTMAKPFRWLSGLFTKK